MEAEPEDRLKKISRREKRWSMNSQRLEEIIAQLMKPISDVRRNFDTDLCALLEEYLTEAGLRALEEAPGASAAPNFAEVALLLQHSAHVYGRKVDCLYQDVLRVTDCLNNTVSEETTEETPSNSKRKPLALGFEPIALEPAACTARESLRPPPTLPRAYIELEPRPLHDDDQLTDEAGEPIGLLADYHVAWRLQDGFLVEELEHTPHLSRPTPRTLTPLSLTPPPPLTISQLNSPPPPPFLPLGCSTPLPKRERKRRIEGNQEVPAVKLFISEEILKALRRDMKEFSLPASWIRREVERRTGRVLEHRLHCRIKTGDFRGWDTADAADVGGFAGFTTQEAQDSISEVKKLRDESDDDGFSELSSHSDTAVSAAHSDTVNTTTLTEPDWYNWRERVLSKTTEKTPDVQLTASRLLHSLSQRTAQSTPIDHLLVQQHEEYATHPAHLTLAALFLANSGNIEIIQGEPLTINSFSIKLQSTDESLYRPAIARDHLAPGDS